MREVWGLWCENLSRPSHSGWYYCLGGWERVGPGLSVLGGGFAGRLERPTQIAVMGAARNLAIASRFKGNGWRYEPRLITKTEEVQS